MKKPIIQKWCSNCGLCEERAPKAFKRGIVLDTWQEEREENIKKSALFCPMMAIEYEKTNVKTEEIH